jgi:hypothetical protein
VPQFQVRLTKHEQYAAAGEGLPHSVDSMHEYRATGKWLKLFGTAGAKASAASCRYDDVMYITMLHLCKNNDYGLFNKIKRSLSLSSFLWVSNRYNF